MNIRLRIFGFEIAKLEVDLLTGEPKVTEVAPAVSAVSRGVKVISKAWVKGLLR